MLFNKKGQYANLTVDEAMKLWSNSGYGGEIVKGKGVDPAAKISDLPPDQQQLLVSAMAKAEGGKIQGSTGVPGTTGAPGINTSSAGYYSTPVEGAGGLTQAAIDQAALQYATTGQMPSIGLGSTGVAGQKKTAILNRAGELGQGTNIAANKASLGKQ